MLSPADLDAHIGDYLQILDEVATHPSIPPARHHDVALMIMLLHELHRSQHLQHQHHLEGHR
jgi:hypothetical protein